MADPSDVMGLQGSYGAQAVTQGLRQRIIDQLNQQQQIQNMDLQRQSAAQHAAEFAQNQQDRQAAAAETRQKNLESAAEHAASTYSPGQSLTPINARNLRMTSQASNVNDGGADNPALAQPPASIMSQGGEQPDIQPGSQPGAVWSGTDAQRTAQKQEAGLQAMGNDPSTPDNIKQWIRLRGNLVKGENPPPAGLFDNPNKAGAKNIPVHTVENGVPVVKYLSQEDVANQTYPEYQAPKEAKLPTEHYQLQPVIDPATGAQTGQYKGFNTTTNRFETVGGDLPGATKAAPGAQQAATWDAKKTDAVGVIDQVDKAIDEAKDLIGPGAGRYASFQQIIGSTDPKVSALKTKLLGMKAKVASAMTPANRQPSAALMQQMDELLGTQVTGEDQHAATKAFREIIGPPQRRANDNTVVFARDASGKLHQGTAGTPLPAGWTLEPKR
jgi:hypothetical protein